MRRVTLLKLLLLLLVVSPLSAQEVLLARSSQLGPSMARTHFDSMKAGVDRLLGALLRQNGKLDSVTTRAIVFREESAKTPLRCGGGEMVESEELLRGLAEMSDGRSATFFWPARFGRAGVDCLYGLRDFTALSRLSTDLAEDQQVVSADLIRGVVGAIPISLTSMVVTSKSKLDSLAVESGDDKEFVDGVSSRLTALIRNGGNLAFRGQLPLFIQQGPNVRSTLAAVAGIGLLGDLSSSQTALGAYSFGLQGSFALTVRGQNDNAVLGTIYLPYRIARVGTFSDLIGPAVGMAGGQTDGAETPVLPRSFTVLQAGFGLANKDDKIRGSVTVTWPLNDTVGSSVPRLSLNLRLLLKGASQSSGGRS